MEVRLEKNGSSCDATPTLVSTWTLDGCPPGDIVVGLSNRHHLHHGSSRHTTILSILYVYRRARTTTDLSRDPPPKTTFAPFAQRTLTAEVCAGRKTSAESNG
ncbi:ferredoxin-NADP reductase [Anopheles sinensis]|uniref:Ferredoxin-NADP reductase n=1 Tax=Anopheles sinensis TaxID=74873 RepID=A0A084VK99_ANOSI|nr:ferredoxin-NADP reductase [Anopheles sinensis]